MVKLEVTDKQGDGTPLDDGFYAITLTSDAAGWEDKGYYVTVNLTQCGADNFKLAAEKLEMAARALQRIIENDQSGF